MKKIFTLMSFFMLFAVVVKAQVDVTFQVDMNVDKALEKFTASNTVSVRGSFNEWGETAMTDDDADGVYTVTVSVNAGTYYYKFYHSGGGGTWEDSKFDGNDGNRKVEVTAGPITAGTFFFNEIGAYTEIQSEVVFNVNMSLPIKQGNVIPGTTNVYIAGNFTDWGNGAATMEDADGDSTYSVTIDTLTSGSVLQYKFLYSAGAASAGTWENVANRVFGVVDEGNEVTKFWDDTNPNVNLADGNILFTVDMSVMEEVGIYDPVSDSVQIRGAFNGWSDSEAEKSRMTQDFLNPNVWTINIPFSQVEVGSSQLYKFYVDKSDTNDSWTDGYERPVFAGGNNRSVAFAGTENQDAGHLYYDGIHPDWVIEEGTTVEITFNVDMTPATDPNLQAAEQLFNPASDSLWWINEQPAFTRLMGWEDVNEMRVLQLTDPDGDMVFSGTLVVEGPAFNAFEYRYGYTKPGTTEFLDEADPLGTHAFRARFISQTGGPRTFDSPYNAPTDTWTFENDKSSQSESGPVGLTSVKEIDGLPNTYSLEQNYPNPFNPTTKIRFSVPQSGIVTLKVFNILGQEVSTLINKELKAGTFEADFNAAGFSSGVYFYTLSTGNFNVTKKMLMLK